MQLTANSVVQGERPKSLSSTRLRKDQMLGATAVGLQALPIQPLDGNNSPPLSTVRVAFIFACYAWFCAPLCLCFSSCQCKSAYLWTRRVHGSRVFSERTFFSRSTLTHLPPLKCPLARQWSLHQLQEHFAYKRTDLQGSIKFHIISHENISRNGDRVIMSQQR